MDTVPQNDAYAMALLQLLGNDAEIADMLRDRGFNPPPRESTVRSWRQRRSISGKWQIVLLQLAIDSGKLAKFEDLAALAKEHS
jgi:hypothetical protein